MKGNSSMKITRRGFLTLWLGLATSTATASLLVACGGTTAKSQHTASSSITAVKPAAGSTPVPSALIAGNKATVTISVWDWAQNWESLIQKLAKEFVTQNPTYKINLQIPPDYYTKLQVAFAGGTGPDVYRTDSPNAFSLAYRNVLLD